MVNIKRLKATMEVWDPEEPSLVQARTFSVTLTVVKPDGTGCYGLYCRGIVAVLFHCGRCLGDFSTEELLKGHYSVCDSQIPKLLKTPLYEEAKSEGQTQDGSPTSQEKTFHESSVSEATSDTDLSTKKNTASTRENRYSENVNSAHKKLGNTAKEIYDRPEICGIPSDLTKATSVFPVSNLNKFHDNVEVTEETSSRSRGESTTKSGCGELSQKDKGVNISGQSPKSGSRLMRSLLTKRVFEVTDTSTATLGNSINNKADCENKAQRHSKATKTTDEGVSEDSKNQSPGVSVELNDKNVKDNPAKVSSMAQLKFNSPAVKNVLEISLLKGTRQSSSLSNVSAQSLYNEVYVIAEENSQKRYFPANLVISDAGEEKCQGSPQKAEASEKLGRGQRKKVKKVVPDMYEPTQKYVVSRRSEEPRSKKESLVAEDESPQRRSPRHRKVHPKLLESLAAVEQGYSSSKMRMCGPRPKYKYGHGIRIRPVQAHYVNKKTSSLDAARPEGGEETCQAENMTENTSCAESVQKGNSRKSVRQSGWKARMKQQRSNTRGASVTNVGQTTSIEEENLGNLKIELPAELADAEAIKPQKGPVPGSKKPRGDTDSSKDAPVLSGTDETLDSNLDKSNGQKPPKKKGDFKRIRKRLPGPKGVCHICGKLMANPRSLKQHLLNHAGIKKYVCEICGHRFTYRSGWKMHVKTKHSETDPRAFLCNHCGKSYLSLSQCREHVRAVHEATYVQCPHMECRKVLKTEKALKLHLRIHNNEKRYKCEFCEMRFIHTSSVRLHRMSHTGEKPCPCPVCGKQFISNSKVRRHIRVHKRKHEVPEDFFQYEPHNVCKDLEGKIVVSSGRADVSVSVQVGGKLALGDAGNIGGNNGGNIGGNNGGNIGGNNGGNIGGNNSGNIGMNTDSHEVHSENNQNVAMGDSGDVIMDNCGNNFTIDDCGNISVATSMMDSDGNINAILDKVTAAENVTLSASNNSVSGGPGNNVILDSDGNIYAVEVAGQVPVDRENNIVIDSAGNLRVDGVIWV